MAIQIIRPRRRAERVRHCVAFSWVHMPGAGFSFTASPSGVPIFDNPTQRKSYNDCLAHVRKGEMKGPFIVDERSSYIECALARCSCGNIVALHDPLDNECEKCHRWYNMCGQEVLDPNSPLGKAMREEDDRYADDEDRLY